MIEDAKRKAEQLVFELDKIEEHTRDNEVHELRVILSHALDDERLREKLYQVVETERAKRRAERRGETRPGGKAGGAAPQARRLAHVVEKWAAEAGLDKTGRLFLDALLGGEFDQLRNRCPLAPKWGPERDADYDHALELVRDAMKLQADPSDQRRGLDGELLVVAGMEALDADREPTRGLFKVRSKSD